MQLYMKIGTMPGSVMRVKYKRKPPQVGAVLLVREVNAQRYADWQQVRVYQINDHPEIKLYLAERW